MQCMRAAVVLLAVMVFSASALGQTNKNSVRARGQTNKASFGVMLLPAPNVAAPGPAVSFTNCQTTNGTVCVQITNRYTNTGI